MNASSKTIATVSSRRLAEIVIAGLANEMGIKCGMIPQQTRDTDFDYIIVCDEKIKKQQANDAAVFVRGIAYCFKAS